MLSFSKKKPIKYEEELAIFKMEEKKNIEIVRTNGLLLKNIENQTRNICLAAVRQNGLALEFVIDQDDEICECAVRENPLAIKFIKNEDLKAKEMEKNDRMMLHPGFSLDDILDEVEKIKIPKKPITSFDDETHMRSR